MKSITQNNENDNRVSSSIINFFKTYKISSILKESNAYKNKGVPVIELFVYLFSLVFENRSMYMNMLTCKHKGSFCKDTVYRFLNIEFSRFILLYLCAKFKL